MILLLKGKKEKGEEEKRSINLHNQKTSLPLYEIN